MFGQKDNRLHMTALSKHIATSYLFYLISAICQISQISCQRRGIAAYIDNPLGSHFKNGVKADLIATFSWWIYYNDIGIDLVFRTVPEGLPLPFR